jgi:DNA-binding CsgD family transcriptional regulator
MANAKLISLIGLIAFALLGLMVLDLAREPEFPPWQEIAIDLAEKLILLAAMAAVAWTVHGIIDRSMAQGDAWRAQQRREIEALSKAIEDQFRAWRLTAAEADVAGLMLKGASQKEIAIARDTTEATIRQQAQSIYRKSGVSGRAELSAYFLESLFETAEDSARDRPNLTVIQTSTH